MANSLQHYTLQNNWAKPRAVRRKFDIKLWERAQSSTINGFCNAIYSQQCIQYMAVKRVLSFKSSLQACMLVSRHWFPKFLWNGFTVCNNNNNSDWFIDVAKMWFVTATVWGFCQSTPLHHYRLKCNTCNIEHGACQRLQSHRHIDLCSLTADL